MVRRKTTTMRLDIEHAYGLLGNLASEEDVTALQDIAEPLPNGAWDSLTDEEVYRLVQRVVIRRNTMFGGAL